MQYFLQLSDQKEQVLEKQDPFWRGRFEVNIELFQDLLIRLVHCRDHNNEAVIECKLIYLKKINFKKKNLRTAQ